MKTRGLTLGKFAPLHLGHQHLIETAMAEVDDLVVLIYDSPETIDIPLNVRSAWLRQLYPQVKVIEVWDGPSEVSDTPEIKKRHEDYIHNVLKIEDITHFFSSEFYGDHMSRSFGAVNRQVDPNRVSVPVTGTQIRQNVFAYRHYLHPIVYKDFITNVVFLGAPSTGKTTLANRMAQEYNTVWMPEYGREYWELHQTERRLSINQLVDIAEGHLEREDALLHESNRYLFTDTNAFTTYVFSMYYHNEAAPRLVELAERAAQRYDLVFLCGDDIPYEDTWDRSGDVNRKVFQKRIIHDLIQRKVPFFTLNGDLECRVQKVKHVLSKFHKFASWFECFQTID